MIAAGVVAGGLAIIGVVVLGADAPYLFNSLMTRGLPLVVLSVACGSIALLLLARGSVNVARVLAAGAVASIVVGWGVAQYPELVPTSLTVAAGAAPAGTLEAITVIAGMALVVIAPSVGLLFLLDQRSRLSSAIADRT